MTNTYTGALPGELLVGVIRGYNKNGTVRINISQLGNTINADVPMPLSWTGSNGEFMGGYPDTDTNVIVSRGKGGQWYIVNYFPSNNVAGRTHMTKGHTKLAALQPGRILLQTKQNKRLFIDPDSGIHMGSSRHFLQANPTSDFSILSHNFQNFFSSTQASLSLDKIIRRDKGANLSRGVVGTTLDSQTYETQMTHIGMDPIASVKPVSNIANEENQTVRNPALVEKKELVYEFGLSYNFTNDRDEANRYQDPANKEVQPQVSRRDMRGDAFSLSLEYPNHLMETIKGTGVDIYGNILDLNRNILPIGRNEVNSLRNNKDKRDAFARIRAQHRKALAFHWEINTRKGSAEPDVEEAPDPRDTSNYGRARSRFFVDIDKEGQFKINVPSSSEVGNVPLHTRYENYSVLESAKNNGETNPNAFLRNPQKRDIFIEDYSTGNSLGGISLISKDPDSYQIPLNYQGQEEQIKLNTAFHDITSMCSTFLSSFGTIVNFNTNNRLNSTRKTYESIVSDQIIVSGEGANGGGRSGQITLDGWLSLNIGANTIDRQSLWVDTAGGVVTRLGKDKNDISYALTTDGDIIIEVGASGLGNTTDSRFEDLNDSFVPRNIEIHVPTSSGPMVFKMGYDPGGFGAIDIISPGQINMVAQQDIMIESTGGRVMIEGQTIEMHPKTAQRQVLKLPGRSI